MKLSNLIAIAILTFNSFNAFAAKTDQEVIDLTAKMVEKAVTDSTVLVTNVCDRSIEFNEEHFSSLIKNLGFNGVLSSWAGSGSPEGSGSYRDHLNGAILVAAPEAYMTKEEFHQARKSDGPTSMALGLKLTIDRHNCKSNDLVGTLEIFRDKNDNVVSKTEFKIK